MTMGSGQHEPRTSTEVVVSGEYRVEESSSNSAPPTPPLTVIAKRRVLGASSRIGLLSGIRDSRWRQRRLMILCYHSISIDDEHQWSGTYSMSPETLESRLRMLRDGRYNVLSLDEGCAGCTRERCLREASR